LNSTVMSVGRSSSSHAPLNVVDSVHYIAGRSNANMSRIFLEIFLECPVSLLEFFSIFLQLALKEVCALSNQVYRSVRQMTYRSLPQFWFEMFEEMPR